LHELADHIVDRGDMIDIEGVPKTQRIGEHGRAEEDRAAREGDGRSRPCRQICKEKANKKGGGLGLVRLGTVVERVRKMHRRLPQADPRTAASNFEIRKAAHVSSSRRRRVPAFDLVISMA
jgi:hypothetical protein